MGMKGYYFMMPNDVFNLMLKPAEFSVLSYLVRCSDKSGISYPSVHTIAQACRISDNTVRKAVKYLTKRKIIKKSGGYTTSKFGKLHNTSFVYSINDDFYNEGFSRSNLVEYFSENEEDVFKR